MIGGNRYTEYKRSGSEWLGEVPAHWDVKRLKFAASCNDDTLSEATPPETMLHYVDISAVSQEGGIEGIDDVEFDEAPSRARRLVRAGDTILSTVRTYLKAVAHIDGAHAHVTVSTGFAVIRPDADLDSRYLSYQVQSEPFVGEVVRRSLGVSYPAINASEVMTFPIALPPLPEQRSIAAFLDRETARIDVLIEKKRQQIVLLDEKRRAIITDAVTRGLDPGVRCKESGSDWLSRIPHHWNIRRLKFCAAFLNSRRVPLSAVDRGGMERNYDYYGASGVIDKVESFLFDEPTILVAEDGANLLSRSTPLAFVARGKYWVNNHAHILRPQSGAFGFWEGLLTTFDYTPLVTGAAQPKLTKEALANIAVPVPPESEQYAIAEYLGKVTQRFMAIVDTATNAVELLRNYRAGLIAAAVTGQIDVGEVA